MSTKALSQKKETGVSFKDNIDPEFFEKIKKSLVDKHYREILVKDEGIVTIDNHLVRLSPHPKTLVLASLLT